MSNDSRYLGSAKLIAVCTLLSRFTGLARDIVLNRHFGQNWVQDAFNYGFLIPNLFRRLFGEGALSAVFVGMHRDLQPIALRQLDLGHRRGRRPAACLCSGLTGWTLEQLGVTNGLLHQGAPVPPTQNIPDVVAIALLELGRQ